MKKHFKTFLCWAFLEVGLLSLTAGCVYLERPYTYHEFDGLFVYYKTQDVVAYRELLPTVFDMPSEPMVMVFVMDYYKMDRMTEPYREAAVFLMAKYGQKTGWHCVTMPVTSDDARVKGIQYLGFPKIMGDVRLKRESAFYTGTLTLADKTIMAIQLTPRSQVSAAEEEWFDKFSGLPSFNLLNGKVYEPEFGGKVNILKASRFYPTWLTIQTGTVSFTVDSAAAGMYSDRLAKVFSFKPTEIVLAYYVKNSLPQTFGSGKFVEK